MRLLSFLVLLPVTLATVVFAVSNRGQLTLRFWPLPYAVDLPVYILALGAVLVGFALGAAVVWIVGGNRRRRLRAAMRDQGARADALTREVEGLRQAQASHSPALPAPAGTPPPR
ncbi:MAG: DUF1049 domain-containing protein [Alphaproteobacteria bacterium]|nr:DUF1049 domain-containing protein [Alphaproteobacteria bacterium]